MYKDDYNRYSTSNHVNKWFWESLQTPARVQEIKFDLPVLLHANLALIRSPGFFKVIHLGHSVSTEEK